MNDAMPRPEDGRTGAIDAAWVERGDPGAIAIVGMACRFPGAPDLDSFWRNLADGVESVVTLDEATLIAAGVAPHELANPRYVRASGSLDDVTRFDAGFFGITPREAQLLDPQQRLFLEVAWEAFEHAGRVPGSAAGPVGVYAGSGLNLYLLDHLHPNLALRSDVGAWRLFITNDKDFLATRTAYRLDLRGPAVNVQAACSTSLVAVHLACQGLLDGSCDTALAGGVTIRLPNRAGYLHEDGMFMSADGHTRTFDAAASGTVFGSGAGAVLLRRLDEAVADGDTIYAVIRGSAINNDGNAKVDFTAPSVVGQAAVIREALAVAGIEPDTVGYIEAHGTATPLGDPIEVAALVQAYGPARERRIGAVKTNIGHLDTAAGIAGLIKTALALHHGQIPPSLHFATPNPELDLAAGGFTVAATLAPWPDLGAPRRAGVSAFGIGGTNAHVILEEAPAPQFELPSARPGEDHVLTLSAATEAGLGALARRHARWLAIHGDAPLADVAATLHVGRTVQPHRVSIAASRSAEAAAALDAVASGAEDAELPAVAPRGVRPPVAFLFTGQGAEHAGMGRGVYESWPVAREVIDRCSAAVPPVDGRSLLDVLFGGEGPNSPVGTMTWAQPALFAVEAALAALWRSWGVSPVAVLGHSVGEYAAAWLAGVFDLEAAARMVAARGRLMDGLPVAGRMIAVRAAVGRVTRAIGDLDDRVAIAAVNGPDSLVISGEVAAVEAVAAVLAAEGVRTTVLRVPIAAHSPLVEPMLAAFADVAAGVQYARPRIPIVSNVTGQIADEDLATPDYWVRHVRRTVRFADGMRTLRELGSAVYVEIGPHPVLLGLGRLSDDGPAAWLPSLRRNRRDGRVLAEAVGRAWARGVEIDWTAIDGRRRPRLALPTYPFQRERHWIEAPPGPPNARLAAAAPAAWPGRRMDLPFAVDVRFQAVLAPDSPAHLADHRLEGTVVVAAATHLAWGIQALADRNVTATSPVILEDVACPRALVFTDPTPRTAQLVIDGAGERLVRVASRRANAAVDDPWATHLEARLGASPADPRPSEAPAPEPLEIVRARCPERMDGDAFYATLGRVAYQAGPSFRWIDALWRGDREALGELKRPAPSAALDNDLLIHPGLIDSCFQVLAGGHRFEADPNAADGHFVPFRIARLTFLGTPGQLPLVCHARLRERQADRLVGDITLRDAQGRILLEIEGFEARRVSLDALARAEAGTDRLSYRVAWQDATPAVASPLSSRANQDWLVLADGQGVGQALARRLRERGERVDVVFAGAGSPAGSRVVDPLDQPAVGALVAGATAGEGRQLRVIHCWGLDTAEAGAAAAMCAGALHVVQALVAAPGSPTRSAPHLVLVTRGAQAAAPEDTIAAPSQATLWGFGRTVSLEHPELGVVLADLDAVSSGVDPDVDARRLLALLDDAAAEPQVALRGERARVPRLHRAGSPAAVRPARVTQGSTAVVTGGLGEIGLAVASRLSAAGLGAVVLVGRSAPRPAALEAIERLRADGCRVEVALADVADRAGLHSALAKVTRELPPVRVVVHAAGVLDEAMLIHDNAARIERVMAPKVSGLENLLLAASAWDLDALVLFSSISGLLGAPGQGAYAAANACLDAVAAQRRAAGQPAISIAWGPWADIGLAARGSGGEAHAAWGIDRLEPAEALARFDDLLGGGDPQLAVAAVRWPAFMRQFGAGRRPPFFEDIVGVPDAPGERPAFRQALDGSPPAARRGMLAELAASQVAAVLGLAPGSPIDPRRRLFDLGLESLTALEVKSRLERHLGVPLRSTLVFDHPTVEALADALHAILSGSPDRVESADRARQADSAATAAAAGATASEAAAAEVEGLADDRLAALLAAELAELRARRGS